MTIRPESELREPSDLLDSHRELIRAFMQGAIYCWVKNRPRESFAVRDLVGGLNNNWNGTPLQVLYDRHINTGKNADEAFEAAAKDLGWIVKTLLSEDRRVFEVEKAGLVNTYLMVGDEI
ncbi:MAG: hypothetical protein ABFD50_01995 [Smithella sp.]